MFSHQLGVFKVLTLFGGLFIAGTSLIFFVNGLNAVLEANGGLLTNPRAILQLMVVLFGSLIPIVLGTSMMDFLPGIRVTRSGVKLRRSFYVQFFSWDELAEIVPVRLPAGAYGVIVEPKGSKLVNFINYYPMFFHGVLAGTFEPIIVLSSSLSHREELLAEISRQIDEKYLRQAN